MILKDKTYFHLGKQVSTIADVEVSVILVEVVLELLIR
jgi:hypothetical protein